MPDGKEDDENELDHQIEHTALDDDVDRGPACSSWEVPASQVARIARGEVPDAPGNEGG